MTKRLSWQLFLGVLGSRICRYKGEAGVLKSLEEETREQLTSRNNYKIATARQTSSDIKETNSIQMDLSVNSY